MRRVYKALIIVSVLTVISLFVSGWSLLNTLSFPSYLSSNLSPQIASEVSDMLSPRLLSIENKIGELNNSLFIESEQNVLDIMNKIDESVVQVRAFPYNPNQGDMSAVVYVDDDGKAWSIGTGFVADMGGNIITANHVVEGATIVKIVLKDGTIKTVNNPIDNFKNVDVAFLRIGSGLPPVKFIEKGQLDVGSDIGFIGFPLSGSTIRTKTKGTISATGKFQYHEGEPPSNVYVINSFVNQGNSGGPVFSLKTGEVIGIINAAFQSQNGIAISTPLSHDILFPN